MRGLKIRGRWLQLILGGEKTMEARSLRLKIVGRRIALGNTDTGKVEGYATVKDVIEIPFLEIAKYESQHLATKWLASHYSGKKMIYGYVLENAKREPNPFPYPKSPAITFKIKDDNSQSSSEVVNVPSRNGERQQC